MRELRLQLLGSPQISLDGVPLAIVRRRAIALLCYLVITGMPHHRDALASLLAGETSDEQARKSLRNTLAALRELEGAFLHITRQTVAFNRASHYWLDVEIVQATLTAAAPDTSLRLVRAAVDLYQGELLAGLAVRDAPDFDEWLRSQREHLHELVVRALDSLITEYTHRGDYADGIACATRLLALEPWREEAHRQMMLLLAYSGHRSAALAQYQACRRILAQELGVAPATETSELFERLRATAVPPPHNLPPPPTTFVGREQELTVLAQRLADPACRLITIVGLGGSGKTRLALEATRRYVTPETMVREHAFPDGIFLVELVGVSPVVASGEAAATATARRIVAAIGNALAVSFHGSIDPARQLRAFLQSKAILLVLDNAEHLLNGINLLADILRYAPQVKLLVTSRMRLQLEEEWVLQLGGLKLPADPATIERTDAGALFLQQAQRVQIQFVPGEADRRHIVHICRLVEGLPLALTLAASWLRGVSCAEVAAELTRGLDLLTTTVRNLPARHRSIRVVVESSWQRLNAVEQVVLRRLSVFRGGFQREAAANVADTSLPQLLALIDTSLVSRDETGRYVIHELVRQYAAEQLASWPNELARTQARHAAYYATWVEQHARALHQTRQALNEMNAEIANLRAAWDWASSQLHVDILDQMRVGLVAFYELMGLFQEGAAVFERTALGVRAALADNTALTPRLQIALGYLLAETAHWLIRQAQYERAHPLLQEAFGLAQATRAAPLEAYSAYHLGELYRNQSNYTAAQSQLEHALTLAREAQLRDVEAACARTLGKVAEEQGNYGQAKVQFQRAAACYRELGDRLGEGHIYGLLGRIASDQGSFAQARIYHEHHLRICREIGDRRWESIALTTLGILKECLGSYTEAEDNFAQALLIAQELGERRGEGITLASLGRNALVQGDFARAQAHYDRSLHIYREIGYRVGESFVLGDLGLLAHYMGSDQQAWDLSRQVIEVAQQVGSFRRQRFGLMVLGHALVGLGDLTEAAKAYEQALTLNRKLDYAHLEAEATAGLARVALAQGDLGRATAYVDTILDHLRTSTLDGTEEPARVFLTCFQVLQATHNPQAPAVLDAGCRLLHARATGIVDTARRRMFFENIPTHRELLRLWRTWTDQAISER
jgi:DNA-binding SARP family transcriptional activator/predicted ATPase